MFAFYLMFLIAAKMFINKILFRRKYQNRPASLLKIKEAGLLVTYCKLLFRAIFSE